MVLLGFVSETISPGDKMFEGVSDMGRSFVAFQEEASERRWVLQKAAQEAGEVWFDNWLVGWLDG